MGRVVDLLECAMESIEQNQSLVLDQNFMMNIFKDLKEELPPLSDYLKFLYKEKKSSLFGNQKSKVIPLANLRDELFSPICETNKDTTSMTIELGKIAASAILKEIRDESKATAQYLSSVSGEFSWGNILESTHAKGLKKMAVNDLAESSFGGTTRQIQNYGRIGLTNAGGVDQVKRNGDFF